MTQPSIKTNYIYRVFYEILTLIVPFITSPYISRVLEADGVGIYSYTSSIMSYFTLFAALGTASYGAREIAQHRDDREQSSKLFVEIELMSVCTSSICILAWVLVIIFSNEYRYYFLALLPTLFGTMFDISWYYTGYEKVKLIVIRNTICKLVGIVLLFALVREKSDLTLYILINSMVTMLGNLSMWTYLPKMLTKVDLKTLQIKRHLKETLVYFIPTIATSVYTVLDKTLIGIITQDSYQNGYYEQANKVVSIVKTAVYTAVNSVMGARISYLFSQEKHDEIRGRIAKSMDYILMLGFGAVFGIWGVASRFVPLFFGSGYEAVVPLLCMMAPLILIIAVSNTLGSQYYTPSGRRSQSAKYIIVGSVVNLILNLCMIPFWGAKGAVIASLVAEMVISILYVTNCDHYLRVGQLIRFSWKRLIAGVVMFICITFLGNILNLSSLMILIIQVAVGVVVYFLALIVLRDQLLFGLINMVINKAKEICRR